MVKEGKEIVEGLSENNAIDNLENYKRKYLVLINNKREKEVWIWFYCNSSNIVEDGSWKDKNLWVQVEDGGACYFQIKINITEQKYYEFGVNGIG